MRQRGYNTAGNFDVSQRGDMESSVCVTSEVCFIYRCSQLPPTASVGGNGM